MLAGGPAFLHQTTVVHYKTVIIDLISTYTSELEGKVGKRIKRIKPELATMLTTGHINGGELRSRVATLYFFWLATHQGSSSGGPIWLCSQYRVCLIGWPPVFISCLNASRGCLSHAARLPEQVIKEYFCQPDAEVVRGDDLLRLFDEFLGLISA